VAQAGRWQSQQRQDVQAEACWRELRATWAGIGGSDRHRHQEVGVLIQKRVQTAAIRRRSSAHVCPAAANAAAQDLVEASVAA
jgi:hypothetical protein